MSERNPEGVNDVMLTHRSRSTYHNDDLICPGYSTLHLTCIKYKQTKVYILQILEMSSIKVNSIHFDTIA